MKKNIILILVLTFTLTVLCSCDMLPDFITEILGNENPEVHEHKWSEATCLLPMTCECGATDGKALGHDMSEATCTEPGACKRCEAVDGSPLGHDMTEATCEEPKTCVRCGILSGEALGHDMTDPTCEEASVCLRCGISDGRLLTHVITHKYSDSALTYYCGNCDLEFSPETFFFLDGEGYDGMTGHVSNADNFTVADKEGRPVIKDGHYELINTTGTKGQLQIWIPSGTGRMTGFSSENSAVGVISFRINVLVDNGLTMRLCDTSSDGKRWSADWCIVEHFITVTKPKSANGLTNVYISGWNDMSIADVTLSDEKSFTGWIDIKIGVVIDSEADQITLYYYADGEYVGVATKDLTTSTNAINSIYISGTTALVGSGLMLDDVAFGYSPFGEWVFDSHEHVPFAASCTEATTCVICLAKMSDSLGHIGGEASCDKLAVCERCGEEWGEYNHDMTESTCQAPSVCTLCGQTDGELSSHRLLSSYSDGVMVYSCEVCDKSFTVQNGLYLDGSDHKYMTGVLNKNNFTTKDGTELPLIKDGAYCLINTSGVNSQFQLWIPSNTARGADVTSGFTSANYASGFFSFRFNSCTTVNSPVLRMQFVDHSSGADRWSEEWCIKDTFFKVTPVLTESQTTVDIIGIGDVLLSTVEIDPVTKYTGWIDVKIGIVLDPVSDQMTLHYYIDGEYCASKTVAITTSTGGINSIYVTGSTDAIGSGLMIDDIAFGYIKMANWKFDTCTHTWNAATCTSPKTCEECDRTVGSPLGHGGGVVSCESLAVCTRCKKTYGDYADHVIPSGRDSCTVCGYKPSDE